MGKAEVPIGRARHRAATQVCNGLRNLEADRLG
jgi:hypothetical protein